MFRDFTTVQITPSAIGWQHLDAAAAPSSGTGLAPEPVQPGDRSMRATRDIRALWVPGAGGSLAAWRRGRSPVHLGSVELRDVSRSFGPAWCSSDALWMPARERSSPCTDRRLGQDHRDPPPRRGADADSGQALVCDEPAGQGSAAYVPAGDRMLHWRLTGEHDLRFYAALAGFHRRGGGARIDGAADAVGASSLVGRTVGECSTGQRRRLMVAARWSRVPRCCCSTSPSPTSTAKVARRCRRPVAAWAESGGVIVYAAPEPGTARRRRRHSRCRVDPGAARVRAARPGLSRRVVRAFLVRELRVSLTYRLSCSLPRGSGSSSRSRPPGTWRRSSTRTSFASGGYFPFVVAALFVSTLLTAALPTLAQQRAGGTAARHPRSHPGVGCEPGGLLARRGCRPCHLRDPPDRAAGGARCGVRGRARRGRWSSPPVARSRRDLVPRHRHGRGGRRCSRSGAPRP